MVSHFKPVYSNKFSSYLAISQIDNYLLLLLPDFPGELGDGRRSDCDKNSLLKQRAVTHYSTDSNDYRAIASLFPKKTFKADENGNYLANRKSSLLFAHHVASHNCNKGELTFCTLKRKNRSYDLNALADRKLSKTSEKIVLAAHSSTNKRHEMTTKKAVFGVTVTGDASFRNAPW